MQFSRTLWLWASLAVVGFAIVLIRFIAPHHVHAPISKPIPDLSMTSPLNQRGGSAISPDAYEVYSALYQSPQTEPLAFAEDSLTDIPQVNGSCLNPSTSEERELTEAFVAANKQSHRWEKRFSVSSKYVLLSATEAGKAESCIETHGEGADCSPYRTVKHVRYLGVPGFDHAHAKALVSIVKKCGKYCGSGGIFVVEKTGGSWRRAEGSDFVRECSWMY
jgi:hypothetical protein